MNTGTLLTRVYYGPHSGLAHLVDDDATNAFNVGKAACCGRRPSDLYGGGWLGTGSQDEIELAAALRLCARCRRRKCQVPDCYKAWVVGFTGTSGAEYKTCADHQHAVAGGLIGTGIETGVQWRP